MLPLKYLNLKKTVETHSAMGPTAFSKLKNDRFLKFAKYNMKDEFITLIVLISFNFIYFMVIKISY